MVDELKYSTGVILETKNLGDGNYTVVQLHQEQNGRLPPYKGVKGRLDFTLEIGPIKLSGYLDTSTLDIGVVVSLLGIDLGTFFGNLKDGLGIKINLVVVFGEIRFYLKNENELWVHVEANILFDGSYNEDRLLLSF